jgi:6-pyruvoyl tetrahydropterin synthase/QueD family protein
MAHALYGYNGACKNIHGHSYSLTVTIKGKPLKKTGHQEDGILMDFSMLKKIVQDKIIRDFDHALVLNGNSPHQKMNLKGVSDKLILLPYQPTCENMLIDFADRIHQSFPEGIKLHSLRLRETGSSYAEWFAEDNHTESI